MIWSSIEMKSKLLENFKTIYFESFLKILGLWAISPLSLSKKLWFWVLCVCRRYIFKKLSRIFSACFSVLRCYWFSIKLVQNITNTQPTLLRKNPSKIFWVKYEKYDCDICFLKKINWVDLLKIAKQILFFISCCLFIYALSLAKTYSKFNFS